MSHEPPDVVTFDGIKMIRSGNTTLWEVEDPDELERPLKENLPMVALYRLGAHSRAGVMFTYGEAVAFIKRLFEEHDLLTPGGERVLENMARGERDLDEDSPPSATFHHWWSRWWPGLSQTLGS